MRVTNGIIQNNAMNSLYTNMGNLDKLFTQMNTLKKIQRPSDDPIVAGRSMKLRINVMESQQHAGNVDEATAWMSVTETALSNMTEIIKSIQERCTQASNGGTMTKDDREKCASDIEQLYEQLKQESNVTYAGRYVFSGYKTDQPVFLNDPHKLKEDVTINQDLKLSGEVTLENDMTITGPTEITQDITYKDAGGNDVTIPKGTQIDKDGNAVDKDGNAITITNPIPAGSKLSEGTVLPKGTTIPQGTTMPAGMINPEVLGAAGNQNIEYEIGVNNTIDVNTTGVPGFMQELMSDMENMIKVLRDPDATEEELNAMFTGMIGEMGDHLSSVSKMTADLGSKQKRLEYTQSRLKEDTVNLTELLSQTENVDVEAVYVEFNTQYMVYQSALQATSKVMMNTLADFLR